MKSILVTGGTVFVSQSIAEYYVKKGWDVFVLNRNTRPQPQGVHLIEADRHDIGTKLHGLHFDAVIDTGYDAKSVEQLLDALESFYDYVFISSSAVYPEYLPQPFTETSMPGENKHWGKYGTNKIEAERLLQRRAPGAYILRPPYLYGPLNDVYREAFVFECAMKDRPFYLPKAGEMKLQFFHVQDLCRFIDILLETKPQQHIFNVGNRDAITIRQWAEHCYSAAGKEFRFKNVHDDTDQRKYFSFYDYEYLLDVSSQYALMDSVIPLADGLKESFEWYIHNPDLVSRKSYIEYIDSTLAK